MDDTAPEKSKRQVLISRRNLLIGAALAMSSGIAFARQPEVINPVVDHDEFSSWIPSNFGNWSLVTSSGVVLPPEDELSDRIYDNLITRVFAAPDLPLVMLLIAYNNTQDGVVQAHRPEVCYPVGGFELSDTRAFEMPIGEMLVPTNIFTATSPNRVEQVVYFSRIGNTFPRNWADQRLAVIEANLAGEIPDGILVRVSTLGINQAPAQTLLSDFSNQFFFNSDPRLQRLLIGQTT